jgi:hypothetical protein
MNRIQDEIDRKVAEGKKRCTIAKLESLYNDLGYGFARSHDCRSIAQHITGPYAGASYPVLTLYIIQLDNRQSAFHIESRRDSNFEAMQQLRKTYFAVAPSHIVEA